MFDFLDCVADLKGKEIKRAALNELVESVATSRGVLIEPLYPEAIKMVRWWWGGWIIVRNPTEGEGGVEMETPTPTPSEVPEDGWGGAEDIDYVMESEDEADESAAQGQIQKYMEGGRKRKSQCHRSDDQHIQQSVK